MTMIPKVRATFWTLCLSGDLKQAVMSLNLDDAAAMASLQHKHTELAKRTLTTQSFQDFLSDDLIMKGAYMLLNKMDGEKDAAGDAEEQVRRIAEHWQPFARMMTEGHVVELFSKLLRDRVNSSWVVLRCLMNDADSPRHLGPTVRGDQTWSDRWRGHRGT